jgi:hypothetical protein
VIWIVGAGHFGYLAAQRLSKRYPEASFLVVDHRRDKLQRIAADFALPVHAEDLDSFFESRQVDDSTWIVPAIPIHYAFAWLLHELKQSGHAALLSVQPTVEAQIPNPYRAPSGSLCASFATFICPDSCNEPDDICTYTKDPRPGNLFDKLGGITVPNCDVIVIRSWQLAPGVGGYPGSILKGAAEKIATRAEGCFLVATSCRCHGVIDALSWKRGGQ